LTIRPASAMLSILKYKLQYLRRTSMAKQSAVQPDLAVVHSTFVLERNYPQSPERVFSAFSFAAKRRRWFADGDHHEVELFEQDFRPGGMERMRYRFKEGSPLPGKILTNEGIYQDIVENRRIVTASAMTLEGKPISASLVTIELLPAGSGTDLICTHQGAFLENSGGPEMREAGWKFLLDKLGKVLESD
jgi:uncharacterized protein YndB with AHSA1/START domain